MNEKIESAKTDVSREKGFGSVASDWLKAESPQTWQEGGDRWVPAETVGNKSILVAKREIPAFVEEDGKEDGILLLKQNKIH